MSLVFASFAGYLQICGAASCGGALHIHMRQRLSNEPFLQTCGHIATKCISGHDLRGSVLSSTDNTNRVGFESSNWRRPEPRDIVTNPIATKSNMKLGLVCAECGEQWQYTHYW